MKIGIGSDHAGFRYKELIRSFLESKKIEVIDYGTHSEEPCDFPDFIFPVAKAVRDGSIKMGIVLGGSGNGEAIAANKIKGIRCSVCWNVESALLSRKHNNSNILSLGQRMIPENDILKIVQVWLDTPFEGGRHVIRLDKIEKVTD